jgi:predicted MFS family arabinose efflux permease
VTAAEERPSARSAGTAAAVEELEGRALWRPVTRLTGARLLTNGALRFTPPFLSSIARSLGVPVEQVGLAMSASELAGLAAPAAGAVIDRHSRRASMAAGLGMVGVGCLIGSLSPGVAVYGLVLLVIGFAKIVFDAAMGAWVADRVPYARRGRVTGFVETAWAGAYLLLIPILAVIAQLSSWRVSMAVLGVTALAAVPLVMRSVESDRPRRATSAPGSQPGMLVGIRRGFPVYLAVLLVMLAAQAVVVVFGAWLQDDLGFSTAAVGGITFLLGAGELLASTGSMRFTDRIGKRRSMLLGSGFMVPVGLALAATAGAGAWSIVLLLAFIIGFEFSLVSILPLMAELLPEARARAITIGFGAGTIGRGVGAAGGSWLYARSGMSASVLLGTAAAAAVFVVMAGAGRRLDPGTRPG